MKLKFRKAKLKKYLRNSFLISIIFSFGVMATFILYAPSSFKYSEHVFANSLSPDSYKEIYVLYIFVLAFLILLWICILIFFIRKLVTSEKQTRSTKTYKQNYLIIITFFLLLGVMTAISSSRFYINVLKDITSADSLITQVGKCYKYSYYIDSSSRYGSLDRTEYTIEINGIALDASKKMYDKCRNSTQVEITYLKYTRRVLELQFK